MRRLIRAAALLYPRPWRKRYGRELDVLLDDVEPDLATLCDVLLGAMAMHLKTTHLIPVGAAILGATCGVWLATLGPDVYVSSAVVRLQPAEARDLESREPREVRLAVEGALGSTDARAMRTSVELIDAQSDQTTLRMTYNGDDAAEALRLAETLTSALASAMGAGMVEIVEAPQLPASPVARAYGAPLGLGGLFGFALGGVVLLTVTSARRGSAVP